MSLTSYLCYYLAILNVIYDNFFKLPNIFCGDDRNRTGVLLEINNTNVSQVYFNFLTEQNIKFDICEKQTFKQLGYGIILEWLRPKTPYFHILFKVPRCVREGLGSYCVISTDETH